MVKADYPTGFSWRQTLVSQLVAWPWRSANFLRQVTPWAKCLKNISQIGSFPQVGVNIKNIWNHHPENNVLASVFETNLSNVAILKLQDS